MDIQFKNHAGSIEVKKEKDDGTLSIRAYALAFGNIDSYGDIIKAGAWSDWSLYSEEIATFGEDHVYDQTDAKGFINLFGLPIKVQAQVDAKNAKK